MLKEQTIQGEVNSLSGRQLNAIIALVFFCQQHNTSDPDMIKIVTKSRIQPKLCNLKSSK
jgi:hypothetical protein